MLYRRIFLVNATRFRLFNNVFIHEIPISNQFVELYHFASKQSCLITYADSYQSYLIQKRNSCVFSSVPIRIDSQYMQYQITSPFRNKLHRHGRRPNSVL
ncbi:Hypothetical_protein [Hexamita inflata]|uniref:Hypothetical_protein n=1 Tax=Hexamita inflata TaxID=28002 RepID=A0ABP1KGY1_9EUKA